MVSMKVTTVWYDGYSQYVFEEPGLLIVLIIVNSCMCAHT